MKWVTRLHHFFVPSRANAYRPPLLGKTSLIFFLALTLAVEGFLVAGLVARQSDGVFLSESTVSSNIEESASVAGAQNVFQAFLRQIPRLFDIQMSSNVTLSFIASLLLVGVIVAFFFHIDVQAHEMLLGGVTVAAIALVCLLGNVYMLGSHQVQAATTERDGG